MDAPRAGARPFFPQLPLGPVSPKGGAAAEAEPSSLLRFSHASDELADCSSREHGSFRRDIGGKGPLRPPRQVPAFSRPSANEESSASSAP